MQGITKNTRDYYNLSPEIPEKAQIGLISSNALTESAYYIDMNIPESPLYAGDILRMEIYIDQPAASANQTAIIVNSMYSESSYLNRKGVLDDTTNALEITAMSNTTYLPITAGGAGLKLTVTPFYIDDEICIMAGMYRTNDNIIDWFYMWLPVVDIETFRISSDNGVELGVGSYIKVYGVV